MVCLCRGPRAVMLVHSSPLAGDGQSFVLVGALMLTSLLAGDGRGAGRGCKRSSAAAFLAERSLEPACSL